MQFPIGMQANRRAVPRQHRLATAAIAAMAAFIQFPATADAQDAFYSPPQGSLAGAPGTIIRQEPALGAPEHASGHRILYRSTGLDGEPIAVSALVIVPHGPAPDGGRPIVAWAHPTSGVVPRCAPSLARLEFDGIQGMKKMLGRGYVVVATDYAGLGTGGTHPYLVGESEARAVIDSVRAARTIENAGGGEEYAVWGHSQGGQAVLFSGLIAESYAPELKLVGVAAAAPATDLATLLRDDFSTMGGKNLTAMTLWSWARIYDAPIDKVVAAEAMPTVNALAEECIETIFDFLERQHTGKPLDKLFLTVPDVTTVEPWQSLMRKNSPGPLPRRMPVFLAQGTGDTTVRPSVTEAYRKSLCQAGSPVRMLMLPDIGHAFVARDSADAAVDWITGRFDGQAAPDDC